MLNVIMVILSMFFSSKTIASDKSFHDFSVESISGEKINLSDFKSKVVLLVNTASQCGFTPQYAGLQKVFDRYKDEINNFGDEANKFDEKIKKEMENLWKKQLEK